MPGSSLWLIPPRSSSFNQVLQNLITNTIPVHFPNTKTYDFIPHVTVTSNIDKSLYGQDPQAWLGSLKLPSSQAIPVSLEILEPGEPFFKKLTVRTGKSLQLLQLAVFCRAEAVYGSDSEKALEWAHDEYLPHLSLMYADLPVCEVQSGIAAVKHDFQKAMRALQADDRGLVAKGGSLVLVDTSKPINEWVIIAERDIPEAMWMSPWSKSRFDD
ncbi:2',3'-cyclic-nucleotide 3'-phosphodiesterase [Delphinella strobiligena]|nr:2',3'-cyclic-nucleotide 3'-phosphodiesterase [Delphinella strobiligena]